jgi:hypothetical protein
MTDETFPLIYCNGDSFVDENYHSTLHRNTYPYHVGQQLGGFVISDALSGSCNRRIIRTSVLQLLEQRRLNPTQEIIALISLSYELRSEIWIDNRIPDSEIESQFQNHQFSGMLNWKERLLQKLPILSDEEKNRYGKHHKDFVDMYSKARAYFYSPYAERINLLCDLVMFNNLCKQQNITFLLFWGPQCEPLKEEHVKDFFESFILSTDNFYKFNSFSFVKWCYRQKFKTIDNINNPIGTRHYGVDAHKAFAEQIVLPALTTLRNCQ